MVESAGGELAGGGAAVEGARRPAAMRRVQGWSVHMTPRRSSQLPLCAGGRSN